MLQASFVLIWIVYTGNGVATGTQQFYSLATCEAAKKALLKDIRGFVNVQSVCAPL